MIRLDSVKMKVPIEAISSMNNSYCDYKPSYEGADNSILISEVLKSKRGIDIGIKNIEVYERQGHVILECSAKMLKENYIEGINKNTIYELLDNTSATGAIKIDNNRFVDGAIVLSCDNTDNIKIEVPDIYGKLAKIPLPNKYDITRYNTVKNEGIVFKGKQKSFKERQIVYNKLIELTNASANKMFRQLYPKALDKFRGIMRVEGNFTSAEIIRHYYKTPDQRLINILNSSSKVNYELFNKITKTATPAAMKLFSEYEGMKWNEIVKMEGYKGIITQLDFDWSVIEQFVRVHRKNNYRAILPQMKVLYYSLLNDKEPRKIVLANGIVESFRDLLYNAA
jgi:hypothetical protein